jgi:hypothetical protein
MADGADSMAYTIEGEPNYEEPGGISALCDIL